jgi:transposase-like protein
MPHSELRRNAFLLCCGAPGRLRTNNPLERLLREVRRRTRAVGAFPDGKSALMLAAASLRHVAGTKWGTRWYLDMNHLAEASEAA